MALITKADVATALGISAADIPDSIYQWSISQMEAMLGIVSSDTTKTYREFIGQSTSYIKLPYTNIKSIDTLTVGSTSVTITVGTNVKFNEDSGLLWYSGGFSDKVVVGLTLEAYTPNHITDAILSTLVCKNMAMFQPTVISSTVKKITIGKYSKTYGSVANNAEQFMVSIEKELNYLRDMYFGDDGQIKMGTIQ